MSETRKTVISKSISRKIQTAKFENLTVTVNVTEEIEWSDLKEKAKKHDHVTKIVIGDFKSTANAVLQELGLSEKPAYVEKQTFNDAPKQKPDSNKNNDFFDEM